MLCYSKHQGNAGEGVARTLGSTYVDITSWQTRRGEYRKMLKQAFPSDPGQSVRRNTCQFETVSGIFPENDNRVADGGNVERAGQESLFPKQLCVAPEWAVLAFESGNSIQT